MNLTNWAGNYQYGAARVVAPASLAELSKVVRSAESFRVLGSRHSFNDIGDTDGDLVSLAEMPRTLAINPQERSVRLDGAIALWRLVSTLEQNGLALHNLGSLPHISVAGAEMRCIAADELWLSPCYMRPSAAVHFTWRPDWSGVNALLPEIEAALAPFAPRPHWAKVWTMDPAKIRGSYPRFNDFVKLMELYDPHGKLRNAYMRRLVGD